MKKTFKLTILLLLLAACRPVGSAAVASTLVGKWLPEDIYSESVGPIVKPMNIMPDKITYEGALEVKVFRIFHSQNDIFYAIAQTASKDSNPTYSILRFYLYNHETPPSLYMAECDALITEEHFSGFSNTQLWAYINDYDQALCLTEETDEYFKTKQYWRSAIYRKQKK